MSDDTPKTPDDYFEPYALELGFLVRNWNSLHDAICRLFCFLMDTNDWRKPLAIWHFLQNDRMQRNLLRKVAPIALNERPEVQDSINWLLEKVDQLGNHRDDLVHTPVALQWEPREFVPLTWLNHPRARNLTDNDLLLEIRRQKENARMLGFYAVETEIHLTGARNQNGDVVHPPLPQKPPLQTVPHKKKAAK